MRKQFISLGAAMLFSALGLNAPQTTGRFEFKPDQSVYVIAIKTSDRPDPQSQRLLREASLKKARQRATGNSTLVSPPMPPRPPQDNRPTLDRPAPERETLERSISEPDTLTSNDLKLKNKLEAEFKQQKKFKLADSAETADVVFFAISRYSSHQFQVRDKNVTGASSAGEGDNADMMSVVAFAIPGAAYRLTKKDVTELGQVARWEGAETGEVTINTSAGQANHSVKEASVKDLVKDFHQDALKKK